MKRQFAPLVLRLCLLGVISLPALAADNTKQIDNLAQQVSLLQQQVSELQAQLKATRPKSAAATSAHHHKHAVAHKSSSVVAQSDSYPGVLSKTLPASGATYLPVDVDVPGQSFVSSGPYLGVPLQYSGSELIVNSPSVNRDLALLKVRKNIHQRLQALGVIEEPDHAHVLLSGEVEGQAMYKNIGDGTDSTDIDVTNTTLDAYILGPSAWLSSLISLTYDNNRGTESGSLANSARALNSRLYVNQAFVTIGNLSTTPIYGTFGQLYVPFGTYSTNMVSSPLTQLVARTKARAIILGYQPQQENAPYLTGYIFKGDTHAGATSRVNNGGINLGYHFSQSGFSGDFGGGAIANIADSVGMQSTANETDTFNGFGGVNNTGNERIAHRVPAYDMRGLFSIGSNINLLGEYIMASTRFSSSDLSMNTHGARPQALNTEAAYTFTAFSRPTSLALGYGMTKDALALQLPAQRYSLVCNTSIWKDTLQSLELRHDINYGASKTASGSLVSAPQASGRADNAITAQFDVYF